MMLRNGWVVLALVVVGLGQPAAAAWESGMVEDEGGETMMAWVAAESDDPEALPPELRLSCGDEVALRYSFGAVPTGDIDEMEPLPFAFDFGDDKVLLEMQYEDLDGAYAAYVATDALIIGYLRTAQSVTIDDPTGQWRVQEFTLEGSSRAIAALLRTCG